MSSASRWDEALFASTPNKLYKHARCQPIHELESDINELRLVSGNEPKLASNPIKRYKEIILAQLEVIYFQRTRMD